MILFMRRSDKMTVPDFAGAIAPYPMFIPVDEVHTGILYRLHTSRIRRISSHLLGEQGSRWHVVFDRIGNGYTGLALQIASIHNYMVGTDYLSKLGNCRLELFFGHPMW